MCIRDRYQRRVHGDRCEHLYNLSERLRENLNIKQIIAERKKKEQEICSFKPKLITKNNDIQLEGKLSCTSNVHTGRNQKSKVQFRTYIWNELRKEKLASQLRICLLYTSPSPRDLSTSRMPSSA
eukprot:TRINITY_DN43658_c0_g2_i1.p1 TRINITY_DN43658_c0_g2~~TRINITY_DN43658_c0_g2_i1.p1  ORF type:complete len:125 (+),score=25.29 TRINITY_DN43658_c0_g2_i1:90-464(+)